MNIEEYRERIEKLAEKLDSEQITTYVYLEDEIKQSNKSIIDLVLFRSEQIVEKDLESVEGILKTGLFKNCNKNYRIACILLTYEIDNLKYIQNYKIRCLKYSKEQPIFRFEPKLFEKIRTKENGTKDLELIEYKVFDHINNTEIVKYNKSYSLIDSDLDPQIILWAKNDFKNNPLYIRINPFRAFNFKPSHKINEAILNPANPNWWKNLKIYNGNKVGAAYILDNFGRLEVIFKRNNNNNLSMMAEELMKIDDYGIMIGRMIHLDTDDQYGNDFNLSTLNHLDLAINIYIGEDALKRDSEDLTKGDKVSDASFRTHLLRIEKVPFNSIFEFSRMFFKSKELVNEWLYDQFQINIPNN